VNNSGFEPERREKAKKYAAIGYRATFLGLGIGLLFLVFLLFSGFSPWLKGQVLKITQNNFLSILLYVAAINFIFTLISFPLTYYSGFHLEHRFSLSNQKFLSWLKDEVKGFLISLILGILLIEALYFLLGKSPTLWWFYTWAAWTLFTVILANLAPVLIMPLFYKFKPLEDEELKRRLLPLTDKAKVRVRGIFRWELGEKSKKANAGLAGWGNTRRIILSDTLLENYTPDEIEVVLAHELGHHKKAHFWKLISFGACISLAAFYLANVALKTFSPYFGIKEVSDISSFPLLISSLFIFILLTVPLSNYYSRKKEKEADRFSLDVTGKKESFISAFVKLADQNLDDVSPHPILEFFLFDHPPVEKRIKMAQTSE